MTTNWKDIIYYKYRLKEDYTNLYDVLYKNEDASNDLINLITTLLEKQREEYVEKYENDIKYLKKIHSIELDALSLKSLEDFIIWKDNRIKSHDKTFTEEISMHVPESEVTLITKEHYDKTS